jgi:hypothetical protein
VSKFAPRGEVKTGPLLTPVLEICPSIVPSKSTKNGRKSSPADLPEKLHEIVKLAVDIAAHGDGTLDLLDVRLLRQNLFGLKQQENVKSARVQRGLRIIAA